MHATQTMRWSCHTKMSHPSVPLWALTASICITPTLAKDDPNGPLKMLDTPAESSLCFFDPIAVAKVLPE